MHVYIVYSYVYTLCLAISYDKLFIICIASYMHGVMSSQLGLKQIIPNILDLNLFLHGYIYIYRYLIFINIATSSSVSSVRIEPHACACHYCNYNTAYIS